MPEVQNDITGDMIQVCGCVNHLHQSGIIRNVSKCKFHRDFSASRPRGLAYYEELRAIINGEYCPTNHLQELESALWEMEVNKTDLRMSARNRLPDSAYCLEVGCGVSPYVEWCRRLGYVYRAVEVDHEAAVWMRNYHKCEVAEADFQFVKLKADLILAFHALEHVEDSPKAVSHIYSLLPDGGRVMGIVPDGRDDPTNPDHMWFFTQETLTRTLSSAGFVDVRATTKLIAPKHYERYIYFTAVKAL